MHVGLGQLFLVLFAAGQRIGPVRDPVLFVIGIVLPIVVELVVERDPGIVAIVGSEAETQAGIEIQAGIEAEIGREVRVQAQARIEAGPQRCIVEI